MINDVYKILTEDEWMKGKISSKIITKLDLKDGFVHLSKASQLNASLSLYFYIVFKIQSLFFEFILLILKNT